MLTATNQPQPLSPLTVADICTLANMVFEQTYFTFNDGVYRQTSGLPMGCNVSGITAIIFMHRVETSALSTFRRSGTFRRYVDDIFALVENEDAAKTLHDILESQHPNISFELELPSATDAGLTLSLLDFKVTIRDGRATFQFYRKPARRDTFVHFASHLPRQQKNAIVLNERSRISSRCTDGETDIIQQREFNKRLSRMGYPPHLQPASDRTQRTAILTRHQPLPTFYLDLPFFNDRAEWKIKNLFRRHGINIRLYRRSNTLFNTLRPKRAPVSSCRWPDCPTKASNTCFVKNVVYQITCSGCQGTYIGQTSRELHVRIRDHILGRGSTLHHHLTTCGAGQFQVDILSKEKDPVNTQLAEGLYIRDLKPRLNRSESLLVI